MSAGLRDSRSLLTRLLPTSDGRRVELRNRQWDGISGVMILRGLDPAVDPAALRAALRRVHAADPWARAVCRLEDDPRRWVPVPSGHLDEWLDRLVVDERGRSPEGPEHMTHRFLREPLDPAPFRLVVGDGYHAWRTNHVLSDGSNNLRHLICGLTRSAVSGDLAEGLLPVPGGVDPMLRAGWNTLVRHPRLATWRTAAERRRMPRPAHAPTTNAAREDRPALTIITRLGAAGPLDALRQWRDEHAPGTSVAVLTMAAARMALEAEGAIDPSADSVVMFDSRRYLPHGVDVRDNFSAALRLSDPHCRDPRRMGEEIRRDIELALPLVSMFAATGAHAVTRGRAPQVPEGPGPVALTHMGALRDLQNLPWAADEESQGVLLAGNPSGSSGTTVCMTEWRKRLNVTVCAAFLSAPPAALARATERLVEDPLALVTTSGAFG